LATVRIACRSVPQSDSVRPDAAAQFAGGEAGQELLLLFLGAIALHRHRHDQVRVDDAGDRHPHRRHALDDLRVGGGGEAQPAVFRIDDAAEQAHLLHLLDDLRGIDVVVLQVVHVGLEAAPSRCGCPMPPAAMPT
jgi:hypothetical protein